MRFEILAVLIAVVVIMSSASQNGTVQALPIPGCFGLCGGSKKEAPLSPQAQALEGREYELRRLQAIQSNDVEHQQRTQSLRAQLAVTPADHRNSKLAKQEEDARIKELQHELNIQRFSLRNDVGEYRASSSS